MISLLLLSAAFIFIAFLVIRSFFADRDGKWHVHSLFPWTKATLVDGKAQRGGTVMRRLDGRWQYRAMTEDERQEEDRQKSW